MFKEEIKAGVEIQPTFRGNNTDYFNKNITIKTAPLICGRVDFFVIHFNYTGILK